eukprot:TRINITY_DN31487_c0_g1_i1.p1 TRINITY_DN31487_c0_g1~~TRINITY_DN31487_c0_g1_i1.p1  ORF type:complete len:830 (+),score=154.48 TRINITY_DN31487_c0_g1_i1:247-2490(+)
MAEVCAAADEGQLPLPANLANGANSCVRLLTRVGPFLMEEPSDPVVRSILWRPGGLEHEGSEAEPQGKPNGAAGSSEAREPTPCGHELVHYLNRFLFLPGFTIAPRSSMVGKLRGQLPTQRVDDRVVWSGGVGVSDKVPGMASNPFLRTRVEVLRCMLACLSGPLFQTAEEYQESPPMWLQRFASGEVCHTANLFCSLMSTVFSYDSVGRGLPYGSLLANGAQEELVDVSLQVLCIALDFCPDQDASLEEEDATKARTFLVDNSKLHASSHGLGYRSAKRIEDIVPSQTAVWGETVVGQEDEDGWVKVGNYYLPIEVDGAQVLTMQNESEAGQQRQQQEPPPAPAPSRKPRNFFRHMLKHVEKDSEIDLIYNGLVRHLRSVYQAEMTYLPGSVKPVGFYQEALVVLWHLLTTNAKFTKRVVERHDTNQVLLPVLYLLQQARNSMHLVGLLHTASFVLLVLSSERSFCVRLNELYTPKTVPLDIPGFVGNHADVLALLLCKVMSEGLLKPQNDALVEMLLTALCNVSPYVKSFALESCLKITALTERLSRPSYFFRTAFTHHSLQFLVEMLNNIVQYQYEGNTMMVYAILRQAEVFERLANLSLEDYKPRNKKKVSSSDGSPAAGEQDAVEEQVEDMGWAPSPEWLAATKRKFPLQALTCLIQHLNPDIEVLCRENEVTDQDEVLRYLKSTTLVGILPVPHPIVIRTYQASTYTSMWFTSYMWGVIFTRSQRMPLYDWKKIRLVMINS